MSKFLFFIPSEGIEMASKRSKMPPNTIFGWFWRIFGWFWGVCPAVFEAFWSHTTAKSVQNVTQFRPKRLWKVLFAARKCRQSAFLVTKMRFASLSPIVFFNCRGWAGGFPAWISASACLWSVAVSWEKTGDGEVHSFAVVCQTMYSNWRVR